MSGNGRDKTLAFRNPPTLNGQPVPMKEPPAPISEEEHEARLLEIRTYLRRMLVAALGRLPEDDLPIFALDTPGLLGGYRRANDRHGAQLFLNVPDETVVNQFGDVGQRDIIILVHIPASAKALLEGVAKPTLYTPDGGTA